MKSKLIIALDFNNQNEVFQLVDQIDPALCALKIGSELFTLFGTPLVKKLIAKNFKIFLDLKFHDIPNTVANACKVSADLGVWMLNVHASGGLQMMQAAKKALESYGKESPLLIAVTVLTSFDEKELCNVGILSPIIAHVNKLALLSKKAGLDGVVCSAFEVKSMKEQCGPSFIAVTPGIRTLSSPNNDQTRIVTPENAVRLGSDYLVIGRPVTQSQDPITVITKIHKSIQLLN